MDTRKTLGLAIDLEQKTAECYERIRRMSGAAPFADDLAKLAKEEIVHANLLKTAKGYESSDPEAFGNSLISPERLEDDLGGVIKLIADIDAGSVTLGEALGRIRDLEYVFERAHLATLVEIKEPRLRALFKALAAEDGGHRRRLDNILRDL